MRLFGTDLRKIVAGLASFGLSLFLVNLEHHMPITPDPAFRVI